MSDLPAPEDFAAAVRVRQPKGPQCTSCRDLHPTLREGIRLALSRGSTLAAVSELAAKHSGIRAEAIARHVRAGHEGEEYGKQRS